MKSFKLILVLTITSVFLLTITACKKNEADDCIEHTVSDCNEDPTKINIRIKNVSDYDFCNVVLKPSETTNYGKIEKGQSTCYRSFDLAYSYAYVQFYIGEKEFVLQPIDYVGEVPLSIGNHTYSIDITDFEGGDISITVD